MPGSQVLQALATLALAIALCLAPSPPSSAQDGGGLTAIGGSPGDTVTATGPDGERVDQPIGQAPVDLALELDGPTQAQIGRPYRLSLIVRNNSAAMARNVRARIAVALQDANGAEVEARGAIRFAGSRPVACQGRICPFGDLPPGASGTVELRAETRNTVAPGQIVFSAALLAAGRTQDRKVVALVASAQPPTEVNLRITVARDLDVVQPGGRFAHVITVRNVSERHDATQVELQIRHRLRVREAGTITVMNDGLRSAVATDWAASCSAKDHQRRCQFPRLRPGEEIRLPVELAVVTELAHGRLGRVETEARVRSAEHDPDRTDNLVGEFTTVASRVPEIAFLRRVQNARGETAVRPTDTLTHGQQFVVAARFVDVPGGEPSAEELPVRLIVEGGGAIELLLRRAGDEDGRYRVYRSPVLGLLAPGAQPPPGVEASRVVHAPADATLRAVYGAGGAAPVEGHATVRAREGSR